MSFVVVQNPRVWWPVIVPVLAEDGTRTEQQFKMRFILSDEETNVAIGLRVDPVDLPANDTPSARLDRLTDGVMELAEDWSGVVQREGDTEKSLPFTRENVRLLLGLPNLIDAILSAYRSCRRADPERRLGN